EQNVLVGVGVVPVVDHLALLGVDLGEDRVGLLHLENHARQRLAVVQQGLQVLIGQARAVVHAEDNAAHLVVVREPGSGYAIQQLVSCAGEDAIPVNLPRFTVLAHAFSPLKSSPSTHNRASMYPCHLSADSSSHASLARSEEHTSEL